MIGSLMTANDHLKWLLVKLKIRHRVQYERYSMAAVYRNSENVGLDIADSDNNGA